MSGVVSVASKDYSTGTQVRDFTVPELREFAKKLYQKLLPIPASKIGLGSVSNTIGTESDISLHADFNCGSTFCVLGWALTDDKLSADLHLTPVIENELTAWDADINDYMVEGVPCNVITLWGRLRSGEPLEGISQVFTVEGHKTYASRFLFDARIMVLGGESLVHDARAVYQLEKAEALIRCACIFLSLEDKQYPCVSNPLFWHMTVTSAEDIYGYMDKEGYLDKAIFMIEKDGVECSQARVWIEQHRTRQYHEQSIFEDQSI